MKELYNYWNLEFTDITDRAFTMINHFHEEVGSDSDLDDYEPWAEATAFLELYVREHFLDKEPQLTSAGVIKKIGDHLPELADRIRLQYDISIPLSIVMACLAQAFTGPIEMLNIIEDGDMSKEDLWENLNICTRELSIAKEMICYAENEFLKKHSPVGYTTPSDSFILNGAEVSNIGNRKKNATSYRLHLYIFECLYDYVIANNIQPSDVSKKIVRSKFIESIIINSEPYLPEKIRKDQNKNYVTNGNTRPYDKPLKHIIELFGHWYDEDRDRCLENVRKDIYNGRLYDQSNK